MKANNERDVLAGVGTRLRELRRARRMSLANLAVKTGLSASTLSRLENGRMRPTLEQLLPLARVHGVPLDDLVDAPATGDPRVHLKPVHRRGLTFVPLTRRPGGIQAVKVIYPAASRASRQGYRPMRVTSGSTCSMVRCALCLTTRTSSSAQARPRSSTPESPTGCGAPLTAPPNCSSSSASTANGSTSTP